MKQRPRIALLIVLMVVASCSALLAVTLAFLQLKSPDQDRLSKANRLVESIERYNIDHGEYPDNLESLIPHYLYELPDTNQESFSYVAHTRDGKRFSYVIITARKPHSAVYEFNSLKRQHGWVHFPDD